MQGFATAQLSTTEFLGKEGPQQERVLQERESSQHASSLFKRVIVEMRMLVIAGIHLSVPFCNKRNVQPWFCVLLSVRRRLEANQRDDTQAEEKITSLKFKAKGDPLHGVSAIPVK